MGAAAARESGVRKSGAVVDGDDGVESEGWRLWLGITDWLCRSERSKGPTFVDAPMEVFELFPALGGGLRAIQGRDLFSDGFPYVGMLGEH